MGKCSNQNCGLESLPDGELCLECSEITFNKCLENKLRKNHQHYKHNENEILCTECCEVKRKVSKNRLCVNCGDSTEYLHRLCSYCIEDTR